MIRVFFHYEHSSCFLLVKVYLDEIVPCLVCLIPNSSLLKTTTDLWQYSCSAFNHCANFTFNFYQEVQIPRQDHILSMDFTFHLFYFIYLRMNFIVCKTQTGFQALELHLNIMLLMSRTVEFTFFYHPFQLFSISFPTDFFFCSCNRPAAKNWVWNTAETSGCKCNMNVGKAYSH